MAAGVGLIAIGGAAMAALLFGPWARTRPVSAFAIVVACSLLVGAGALLVQDEVGAASWVVGLLLFAIVGPAHARMVFGRPGMRR